MKISATFLKCGLIIALAGSPSRAEEFPLTYRAVPPPKEPQTESDALQKVSGLRGYPVAIKAPGAVKKLPRFRSATPFFAKIPVGASSLVVAFDKSRKDAPDYDVLYADANGNGDLTDDEVYRWRTKQSGAAFDAVRVTALIGGAPRPYVFSCALTALEVNPPPLKISQRECWVIGSDAYRWEGTVRFGDRPVKVALQDGNSNGRFDDRYRLYRTTEHIHGSDALLLDFSVSGHFDWEAAIRQNDCNFLGSFVRLDGQFYQARVVQRSGTLFLAVEAAPLGTIRCNYDDFGLDLIGDNGLTLSVKGEGGEVKVPVGDYDLGAWRAFRTDKAGRKWQADREITLQRSRLSIKVKEPAVLRLPVSFFAEIKVTETVTGTTFGANGKPDQDEYAYEFSLRFKGERHEKLDAVNDPDGIGFLVDGNPLRAWFHVVDAGNNTIARLATYSDDARGWEAPQGTAGKLHVLLELDDSPFQLIAAPAVSFDAKGGGEER